MRKSIYASMLLPALLSAGTLQQDLKLVIDADSAIPAGAGVTVSTSIRKVPGKFGKGFLIERRTVNDFKPSEVILSDGATLKGKTNKLTLPAGGEAALPLTGIRVKSVNTLSFLASGTGKLTITQDDATLKTIDLKANAERYFIPAAAASDSFTIRISSDKGATLDEVMFDKGIPFANTYHKPGPMRYVDVINLDPAKYYNKEQGAISLWVKAPWLNPEVKGAGGIAFFGLLWTDKSGKRFTDNIVRSAGVWSDTIYDSLYGAKGTNGGASFKLNERKVRPADGWNHLVLNWKAADGKIVSELVINGEQSFNKTSVFQHKPEPVRFMVGYIGGAYLNGVLDDFAVFSRPLSKAEIKQIFSSGKPLKETVK